MARTVTLFEHETKEYDWTDRDLAALERLHCATGVEILRATTRNGKRALKAAQHVGVVRLRGRTVQVLPKIYPLSANADEQQHAREATRNLLYMLAYAGQLQMREQELAGLLHCDKDWFDLLTRLFAMRLKDEWQRGAYRGYQVVEEELAVLKGKWRLGDQLRRPERRHIFTVAHDEFSADNSLNRVFRFVTERLWKLTGDSENRQLLGDLRQWMDEVALVPEITARDVNPSMLTRLNQRYAPLLNIARLFIEGGALQLAAGDVNTFALVFDMNQLFESFTVNFIRRHRRDILPVGLQPCELLSQSHGETLYLAKRDGADVFRLRPDLVFRDGDHFPLLIDMKYARLDAGVKASGIAQANFYQMYAYARRYECPRVLMLYPQTSEMPAPHRARFVTSKGDNVIEAATIDLRLDLSIDKGRQKLIRELKECMGGTKDV